MAVEAALTRQPAHQILFLKVCLTAWEAHQFAKHRKQKLSESDVGVTPESGVLRSVGATPLPVAGVPTARAVLVQVQSQQLLLRAAAMVVASLIRSAAKKDMPPCFRIILPHCAAFAARAAANKLVEFLAHRLPDCQLSLHTRPIPTNSPVGAFVLCCVPLPERKIAGAGALVQGSQVGAQLTMHPVTERHEGAEGFLRSILGIVSALCVESGGLHYGSLTTEQPLSGSPMFWHRGDMCEVLNKHYAIVHERLQAGQQKPNIVSMSQSGPGSGQLASTHPDLDCAEDSFISFCVQFGGISCDRSTFCAIAKWIDATAKAVAKRYGVAVLVYSQLPEGGSVCAVGGLAQRGTRTTPAARPHSEHMQVCFRGSESRVVRASRLLRAEWTRRQRQVAHVQAVPFTKDRLGKDPPLQRRSRTAGSDLDKAGRNVDAGGALALMPGVRMPGVHTQDASLVAAFQTPKRTAMTYHRRSASF